MVKEENKYYTLLGSIIYNFEFNLKFIGWSTNDSFISFCFVWVD